MKKFILIAMMFILIIQLPINHQIENVNAEKINYARIEASGSYLYKTATANPSINNIWCELEKTYFVQILNDYNDQFYKVSYNSIIGFAKKSDLNIVLSTPLMPYPSGINIKIKNTNGCYLRSSPISKTSTNNIIKTLNKGTKNILFIGYIHGDENIDLKGNVWYLVKYEDEIGYIFSDFVENKVTLYPNLEEISLLNNNLSNTLLNPINNSTTAILIGIILLPCLIILAIMFLPKKATANIRKKNKKLKEIKINEITDIYNDLEL